MTNWRSNSLKSREGTEPILFNIYPSSDQGQDPWSMYTSKIMSYNVFCIALNEREPQFFPHIFFAKTTEVPSIFQAVPDVGLMGLFSMLRMLIKPKLGLIVFFHKMRLNLCLQHFFWHWTSVCMLNPNSSKLFNPVQKKVSYLISSLSNLYILGPILTLQSRHVTVPERSVFSNVLGPRGHITQYIQGDDKVPHETSSYKSQGMKQKSLHLWFHFFKKLVPLISFFKF